MLKYIKIFPKLATPLFTHWTKHPLNRKQDMLRGRSIGFASPAGLKSQVLGKSLSQTRRSGVQVFSCSV